MLNYKKYHMCIHANKKVRISNQAIAHKNQTNEHCL